MRLHLIQSHQEFSIVYKYGKPTVLTWQSLESGKRKSEGILERQTSLHTPSSLFSPLQLWLKGPWWQVALSITHWETGLGWILLGETAGQTRFLALDTKTHSCSSRKTPSLTESLRETHKQVWGERVQPFFSFFIMASLLWLCVNFAVWKASPENSMCLWKPSQWMRVTKTSRFKSWCLPLTAILCHVREARM